MTRWTDIIVLLFSSVQRNGVSFHVIIVIISIFTRSGPAGCIKEARYQGSAPRQVLDQVGAGGGPRGGADSLLDGDEVVLGEEDAPRPLDHGLLSAETLTRIILIVVFVFLVVLADFTLERDILPLLLVQLAVEAVGPVLAGLPLLVLLPRVLPLPGAFPLAEVCWVIPVRKLRTVILLLLADFTRGLDTRFSHIFGFAQASQEFCSRLQAT